MSTLWRFSPVARAPRPEDTQEDVDARFAAGYDDAVGEIYDTNALSFSDAYGKRYVYHIRCGQKLGGGRMCLRRAGHPEDQCDPRWEFP